MPDIGRLALHLPAGFEHRATRLAGLTARALSRQSLPGSGDVEAIALPALRLDPRRSDRALADTLAAHIARGIAGATGEGDGPC